MSDVILDASNLDVHYGRVQVLFDVSISVERGEFLALLGTNGAGKSTLFRALTAAPLQGRFAGAAAFPLGPAGARSVRRAGSGGGRVAATRAHGGPATVTAFPPRSFAWYMERSVASTRVSLDLPFSG